MLIWMIHLRAFCYVNKATLLTLTFIILDLVFKKNNLWLALHQLLIYNVALGGNHRPQAVLKQNVILKLNLYELLYCFYTCTEILKPRALAVLSHRNPSEKWPTLSPLGRHADPVLFKFPPYSVLSEMMFGGEM